MRWILLLVSPSYSLLNKIYVQPYESARETPATRLAEAKLGHSKSSDVADRRNIVVAANTGGGHRQKQILVPR